MKASTINEIEEAVRLLVQAADKLYEAKGGYSNYGRGIYELADDIQEQLDQEVIEL